MTELETIIEAARDPDRKRLVARNVYLLSQNPWSFRYVGYLMSGHHHREQWFTLLTFLHAFSELRHPKVYLEIGVHKGASMVQVISQTPTVDVFGFDMWPPDYAVLPEWPLPHVASSPDFVRSEISRFNPQGKIEFFSGDSAMTLPEFFKANPNFIADLGLVDGDHSAEGAMRDLMAVKGHVKTLVFDDIIHPSHLFLEKVWDDFIAGCDNVKETMKDKFDVGTAVATFQ